MAHMEANILNFVEEGLKTSAALVDGESDEEDPLELENTSICSDDYSDIFEGLPENPKLEFSADDEYAGMPDLQDVSDLENEFSDVESNGESIPDLLDVQDSDDEEEDSQDTSNTKDSNSWVLYLNGYHTLFDSLIGRVPKHA
jgi:hypothetical protein